MPWLKTKRVCADGLPIPPTPMASSAVHDVEDWGQVHFGAFGGFCWAREMQGQGTP